MAFVWNSLQRKRPETWEVVKESKTNELWVIFQNSQTYYQFLIHHFNIVLCYNIGTLVSMVLRFYMSVIWCLF